MVLLTVVGILHISGHLCCTPSLHKTAQLPFSQQIKFLGAAAMQVALHDAHGLSHIDLHVK